MKVLIVNTYDLGGGAARASHRLYESLRIEGIDCKMLVIQKESDDYNIIGPKTNFEKLIYPYQNLLDSLRIYKYREKTKTLFSSSFVPSGNLVKKINELDPDIVHLHWICGGMIKISDLKKIRAPIVWSLHDMWAFTGGCHYSEGCKNYEKTCGNCKVLKSNTPFDLSNNIWKKKQITYSQLKNITIIGLSSWLKNLSENSSLLKDKVHINLPNPIDTHIFKAFEKSKSRELWNLPANKKLILFGAMGATSDPRKGYKELSSALRGLKDNNVELVIFGSNKPKDGDNFPFKTHYLGQLHDDVSLTTLYSAVDLMIVPSLQENLSNAIMESLSCSTPVVAFDIGGNHDMIDHKVNGYLAKPFDIADLINGIEWILLNKNYETLRINARKKILENFDSKLIAKKYIKLYENIIHT